MREARVKSTSTVFPLTTDAPIIGFTEGSVIFIDASGTLAQDNANFFWDDTNNRLRIGEHNTSQGGKLIVTPVSTETSALYIRGDQNDFDAVGTAFGIRVDRDITTSSNASLELIGGTGIASRTISGASAISTADNHGFNINMTNFETISATFSAGSFTSQTFGLEFFGRSAGTWTSNKGTAESIGGQFQARTDAFFDNAASTFGANTYGVWGIAEDLVTNTASTALVTNTYGGYFDASSNGAGSTTNVYGVYIADATGGSANWGIYNNTASDVYLGTGNVGIGTTAPGALTEIEVGATAAKTGLLIDADDADQIAFQIDAEQTTADIVDILATVLTTGRALDIPDLDALTTGTGINLVSNSADTSERYLVNIDQDHASATGARALRIKQDSTATAQFIDQNGNGIALDIDAENTTADAVNIVTAVTTGVGLDVIADSLTTGNAGRFYSNSSDTSTRTLVQLTNDNTLATGATLLTIRQDAAQRAVLIDQDADALGIYVDKDVTNANNSADNTVFISNVSVVNDAGTYTKAGSALKIESAVTETSGTITDTSNVLRVDQLHADATGDTVFINSDATGAIALNIDAENTTANAVNIDTTVTSGFGLDVLASSLTTGQIARFYSNSADISSRFLVQIVNDNTLATGATSLVVQQDAAKTGVFIDQNGNGFALNIDAESTTDDVIDITSPATTTGIVFDANADALTTGSIMDLTSNSADTGIRNLVNIVNDNTLAANATALRIQQDADVSGIFIDMNTGIFGSALEIDAETTEGSSLLINSDVLTLGNAMRVSSNATDISSRSVVLFINENTLAVGCSVLNVRQDAAIQAMVLNQTASSSFCDYQGTAGANVTNPISTLGTAGTVQAWLQIEVNGTKRWIPAYSDPSA